MNIKMMNIKIKGIFIKTLLIVLSTSFVLMGMINFFTGIGQNNILQINDEKINVRTFINFLNTKRTQLYVQNPDSIDYSLLNSKEFINMSLFEFLNDSLFKVELDKLKIEEPQDAVFADIYADKSFADKNNNFDILLFNKILKQSNLDEKSYVEYLQSYNTRNSFLQLLLSVKLINNKNIEKIFMQNNKYIIADVIIIYPDSDLETKIHRPSSKDIENYYIEHKSEFITPEKKIISYIDINTDNKNLDNTEDKLTKIEDLILSSNNMDDLSNFLAIKKEMIDYNKLDENILANINNLDKGIFSDLIYKDSNIYRVYYIEDIIPNRVLSLKESEKKIIDILSRQDKTEKELEILNKIRTQIRNNGMTSTALRNNLRLDKNESIYRNNTIYPDVLINELYSNMTVDYITKPIYDEKKNIYYIANIKNISSISKDNKNYNTQNVILSKTQQSYGISVIELFKKYMFNTNKIIVNQTLLNSLTTQEE